MEVVDVLKFVDENDLIALRGDDFFGELGSSNDAVFVAGREQRDGHKLGVGKIDGVALDLHSVGLLLKKAADSHQLFKIIGDLFGVLGDGFFGIAAAVGELFKEVFEMVITVFGGFVEPRLKL